MSYQDLEKLIYSLSSSEKKQFQLYSNQSKNEKYYALLFQIILEHKNKQGVVWQQLFKEKYPAVSLESTANYLFKVLTDVLLQIRIEQDSWFQQYYGLMKARLCFERSIPDRGMKEIQSVYKKANQTENFINKYNALRMELDVLHSSKFSDYDEQQIVDKQMEAKMAIQSIREIQEHYSLYELLNIRLANNPTLDQYTDDLILGELSLSFRGNKTRFETQKLHLLFQAFYFIHKTEYRSALMIFKELSNLFEENLSMWNFPPYDYLSTLDGILNSLANMKQYTEMQAYIDKLSGLGKGDYTEHFHNLVHLSSACYQLQRLLGERKYKEAATFIQSAKENHLHIHIGDVEKAMEWYFLQALTNFYSGNYTTTKKVLNEMFDSCVHGTRHNIFRAAKLLYLKTIYEIHDCDYMESEVRALKRQLQKLGKRYNIENLVFRLLATEPKRRGNEWKKKTLSLYQTQLMELQAKRKEEPLLKYFDYDGWISRLLKS
ncbi:hypothetical protein GQF61_10235 [Sphingobacterium sp. DK4209]|uniref:Uncharacterized protein n=1 Tax=Sphingobacterium zhuxiongii TaxID=2662364 RepID=A0A5Q0QCM2_9SPHI|nr:MULTISPECIES: hypothetical protein [unclassified Sphingobacterium]MVZ66236.1 hypothetical protein [Sphingobacterium sp. DK4209]QGA24960.1 hypothetical protein GFH32_00870 [Sphingobacterium sp. dk4302]